MLLMTAMAAMREMLSLERSWRPSQTAIRKLA